jgi:hypothetical protein
MKKRLVRLGLAAGAVAAFALPAPAANAQYCGGTFQPPCQVCQTVSATIGRRCVTLPPLPDTR